MTPEQRKEERSFAVVRAIATDVGYQIERPAPGMRIEWMG